MVDILFVVPALEPVLKEESIGSLILAQIAISAGYSASIVRYWEIPGNQIDYPRFRCGIVDRITLEEPKIVSFYCRCTEYHICIDIAKKLKEINNNLIIVFGGPQAEAVAKWTLNLYPFVDYICCSEGENTIVPFLRFALNINARNKYHPDVEGLVYRDKSGQPIQIPFPAFLPDEYISNNYYYGLIPENVIRNSSWATIDVGRGCPFSCTFCSTKLFWQRKFRLRNLDNLIDEIKYVYSHYNVERFGFDHDLFTANKQRVLEFCHKLKKNNLPIQWECSSRFDTIDEETIDVMKDAGLRKIFFGLESGSERIQHIIGKKINICRAISLVEYCVSHGLRVMVSFMYGFPDETEDELEMTLSVIRHIQRVGGNIMINICTFFSGTQLCNDNYSSLSIKPTDINFQTYFGLDEMIAMVLQDKPIFVQFYDYPNNIRNELKYIDIFLHLESRATAGQYLKLENQLRSSGMRFIDIYRFFVKTNFEVLNQLYKKCMGNYKLISSSYYNEFIHNMSVGDSLEVMQ